MKRVKVKRGHFLCCLFCSKEIFFLLFLFFFLFFLCEYTRNFLALQWCRIQLNYNEITEWLLVFVIVKCNNCSSSKGFWRLLQGNLEDENLLDWTLLQAVLTTSSTDLHQDECLLSIVDFEQVSACWVGGVGLVNPFMHNVIKWNIKRVKKVFRTLPNIYDVVFLWK